MPRHTRSLTAALAVSTLVTALVATTAGAAPRPPRTTEPPTVVAEGEPALATVADQSVWSANGRVMSLVPLPGNRVAVGGGFSSLGPSTGHAAVVGADGRLALPASMVNGDVTAVLPDGVGGHWLGGSFTRVDGATRLGLARLGADGRVDKTFKADVTGAVQSLAVQGSTLVVGGTFTNVNGTARTNLAVVASGTGVVQPQLAGGANGAVTSLLSGAGGVVWAGGAFTSVASTAHARVARITPSGTVDAAFQGRADKTVRALALSPDGATLYAGGDFTTAGGVAGSVARTSLAAFSPTTGAVSAWAPAAPGGVAALAVHASGTVYVAGAFTTLAGQARRGFGAVAPGGAVTTFDVAAAGCHQPHTTKDVYTLPACATTGSALAIDGTTVYLGGNFATVKGIERQDAAAVDVITGAVTAWAPTAGAPVLALATDAGRVVMGGTFSSVNGLVRRGIAVLDLATGQADPAFRADVTGMVLDVEAAPDGSGLYLAGQFTAVKGVARSNAAKVSTTDGTVDATFAPVFDSTTIVAAVAGTAVYFGGKFTTVGTVKRLRAAKVSGTTGLLDTQWVADTTGPSGALRAGGMVQGIEVAPDGSKVYLAGPFSTINKVAVTGGISVRNGTTGAAVGSLGGVLTSSGCGDKGPWINRLYLSPDGQRLYGGDVCPDYIYQWDAVALGTPQRPTGLLWRAWCNAGMQGALEVNGRFYYGSHGGDQGAGGQCSLVPGGFTTERSRLAVFDQATGNLLDYQTLLDTPMGVWSFAATSRGLLLGGDFTMVGDRAVPQQSLALLAGTP